MVESPKTWKNRSKLLDSFEFTYGLKSIGPQKLLESHEKQALSVAQIAEFYGLDKDSVRKELRKLGVNTLAGLGRMTNPENYRAPNPPYGYRVEKGKLKECLKEKKVCRLIVELKRKDFSLREIAREL